MYSDELMEMLLGEEDVPEELIHTIVKDAVQGQDVTPVFLGSAYKNKGVQPLLDAIVRYLPSPLERQITAKNWDNPDEKIPLEPRSDTSRSSAWRSRSGRRSVRPAHLHAHLPGHGRKRATDASTSAPARSNASAASCGCTPTSARKSTAPRPATSWRSWASMRQRRYLRREAKILHAGKHVRGRAGHQDGITPANRDGTDKLAKALQRFRREDPTFRVFTDEETGETLIAGMGELHLEIYVERIRREYKVEVEVGAPKVSYREAPTQDGRVQLQAQEANRRFRSVRPHRRQLRTAAGRRARSRSNSKTTSSKGAFRRNTFPRSKRVFARSLNKGPIAGFPIVG